MEFISVEKGDYKALIELLIELDIDNEENQKWYKKELEKVNGK